MTFGSCSGVVWGCLGAALLSLAWLGLDGRCPNRLSSARRACSRPALARNSSARLGRVHQLQPLPHTQPQSKEFHFFCIFTEAPLKCMFMSTVWEKLMLFVKIYGGAKLESGVVLRPFVSISGHLGLSGGGSRAGWPRSARLVLLHQCSPSFCLA